MCSKNTSIRLKVEVHALFTSESHTDAKYFAEASPNTVFQTIKYDTILDRHSYPSQGSWVLVRLNRLGQGTSGLVAIADQLGARVDAKLEALGLHGNIPHNSSMCKLLCKAGLVSQLILLPMKTLRDIQIWANSDDIL